MTQDTHDSDDDQHASPAGPAEDGTGYLPTTRRTFLGTIAAASAMGGGSAGVAAQGGGAGVLAQEAASSHGYGVSSYGEGPCGGEADTDPGDDPPPLPGEDDPPQDLNGDGLYRDVDGDGQFTIRDVQVFFNNRDSDVVQNNPECFNFDEQDPPAVIISDAQALFMDFTNGVSQPDADRLQNDSLGELGDPDSVGDIDVRSLFGGD